MRDARKLKHPYKGCTSTGPYYHKGSDRMFLLIKNEDGRKVFTQYSRYLLEVFLGRYLTEDETVDHVDGNRLDDSVDNLRVLLRKDNVKEYRRSSFSKKAQIIKGTCPVCLQEFNRKRNLSPVTRGYSFSTCSRRCRGVASSKIRRLDSQGRREYLNYLGSFLSTIEVVSNTNTQPLERKRITPDFLLYSES